MGDPRVHVRCDRVRSDNSPEGQSPENNAHNERRRSRTVVLATTMFFFQGSSFNDGTTQTARDLPSKFTGSRLTPITTMFSCEPREGRGDGRAAIRGFRASGTPDRAPPIPLRGRLGRGSGRFERHL